MTDEPAVEAGSPEDLGTVGDAGPESRALVRLPARTYRVVDRGSKLVGIVAIGAGLAHAAGPLSPVLALVGLLVGVATVFVGVEQSSPDDGPRPD